MVEEESLKITEINIMFLGQGENEFKGIISDLDNFLRSFSLEKEVFSDDQLKCNKLIIKKEESAEVFLNNNDDFLEQEEDIIINIFNFQNLPQLKENSKQFKDYDEFYKTIDFCFVFNLENQIALNKIYNYSKGNCIFFSLIQNFDEKIKEKYPKGKIYDILSVKEDNQNDDDDDGLKTFFFEKFLKDIINKFDMFLIFEKYSVEKSIIKFIDYYHTFNEYSKIKDEQELIELFNKFEKFSFNNDYADITIILLQIMANSNDMLKNNFSFKVKSLNCLCGEKMDICEFDKNVDNFLCYRCKLNQNLFQKKINN